jgi:hypothetical protein
MKRFALFIPIGLAFFAGSSHAGELYGYSEKLKIGLAVSWSNLGSAPVNNPTVKGKYGRNKIFLFNVKPQLEETSVEWPVVLIQPERTGPGNPSSS